MEAWFSSAISLPSSSIIFDTDSPGSHSDPFLLSSCSGPDRLTRLVVARSPDGVHAFAAFHTGRLMTGPAGTLQGGMQECLLATAMAFAARERGTGGFGKLERSEVGYKARVAVPGYYRISGRLKQARKEGRGLVLELEGAIEEPKGDGWAVLATGKATRVFADGVSVSSNPSRERAAIGPSRISRPMWAEVEALLAGREERSLVAEGDAELGRFPSWVGSETSGFPWRTCFGPGRISRIAAVLDKAEQALSGALFFDRGTEGAEAGGGLVSASALFAILDYLAVETSIRVLRASGRTGTAVTANMALGYLELPRVPGLVHFRNRVDRVEGRKIFLAIEARDSPGGKPYARGTALFVSVPGGPPKL